ncbi:hypothetical protein JMJ35_010577 [Cladonia borealis]|uniref:Uncharacterized protein n=1 Tax=Cladonia borealis TaxID=184061 RepID=A0AA39UX39_9LECA|nr:hypothetical protein JMJ35_010577 [Cladonia borealis]
MLIGQIPYTLAAEVGQVLAERAAPAAPAAPGAAPLDRCEDHDSLMGPLVDATLVTQPLRPHRRPPPLASVRNSPVPSELQMDPLSIDTRANVVPELAVVPTLAAVPTREAVREELGELSEERVVEEEGERASIEDVFNDIDNLLEEEERERKRQEDFLQEYKKERKSLKNQRKKLKRKEKIAKEAEEAELRSAGEKTENKRRKRKDKRARVDARAKKVSPSTPLSQRLLTIIAWTPN